MKNSDLLFFAALIGIALWWKKQNVAGQVTETDLNSAYTSELERRNSTPWTKDPDSTSTP